jgi:ElaB/YqjD/DUF883 family membrane-anchored ribosome-binding protein
MDLQAENERLHDKIDEMLQQLERAANSQKRAGALRERAEAALQSSNTRTAELEATCAEQARELEALRAHVHSLEEGLRAQAEATAAAHARAAADQMRKWRQDAKSSAFAAKVVEQPAADHTALSPTSVVS